MKRARIGGYASDGNCASYERSHHAAGERVVYVWL